MITTPKSAKEGDTNYSGGKEGSGQPAVVYSADIDLASGKNHSKQHYLDIAALTELLVK